MAVKKLTLAKAFGAKQKETRKPGKPKGIAPHIDWAYLADMFLNAEFNVPGYGTWVGSADWLKLNPYGHRSQGCFHPSSGLHHETGGCERLIMFDLMMCDRSPQDIQPLLAKILDNGTNRHIGLHVMFMGMAKRRFMGIVSYRPERKVHDERLCITGHLDGDVEMEDGHTYTLDFKTINSKNFQKTYEPTFKHRVQLNTYMGMGQGRTGYLIYENKDNQSWATPMQTMRVDFDPRLWNETQQFCVDVLRRLAEGRMPAFNERVCDKDKTFCAYQAVCKMERDGVALVDLDQRDGSTLKRHLQVI